MIVNAMAVAAAALVALSGAGCAYLVLSAWAVRRLARRRQVPGAAAAPVSVLKPLCGEDAELEDNLRSFCRQDYPHFQVVFGVRDDGDPALPVVRRVMAAFPDRDLRLVVAPPHHASNLKVANLLNMLPAARHDILVISDSDMRVTPGYLAAVTAPLADPAVGIVTCLYRGIPAGGIWSTFGCLHVNHGFLPQAAVAAVIGAGAGCFGASIALRRDTLERIGGFAAVADALADDYALGAAVRRIGRRIELSAQLVDNVIAEPGLAALMRHELRWARTIRLVAPAGFAGSIVTQPVAVALLAVALGALPAAAPAMLVLALVCRAATARAIDRSLGLPPAPLHLLPLRDVLSFTVFVASFFARRVAWRDRTFRVSPSGEMTLDGDSPA
ncbi:MAG TPA: bacteriohopanetetrol glucosamine biosynthesis glycosyltransferase HpnI [Stellaceae bacterium]|nr:bacteriohopanetetrol glucosamine biosynthesis glycosyltransferase HpnI [Stellaceae bacterium]